MLHTYVKKAEVAEAAAEAVEKVGGGTHRRRRRRRRRRTKCDLILRGLLFKCYFIVL